MNIRTFEKFCQVLFVVSVFASTAFAAERPVRPTPPEERPAVPKVGTTESEPFLIEQAGVGSNQSYARRGVLELGGFLAFNAGNNLTQFSFRPTAGWFFMDNWQISLLPGVMYSKVNSASTTTYSLLAEPSFHIPFDRAVFGFIGLGFGIASNPGIGASFAPRIGANIMVGRSGILTPAFGIVYSGGNAVQTNQGTLLTLTTAYQIAMGYTVMW